MYEITKINQKDLDLFRLFICIQTETESTEETIDVTGTVLSSLGILKPCLISTETYQELMQKKAYYQAYNQAIGYLGYRKRSVFEVKTYLENKEIYTPTTIEAVVTKLLEQKYLDDADFISSYITTTLQTTTYGPFRMREKLLQYGCEQNQIDDFLYRLVPDTLQQQQASKIFDKMLKNKYFSLSDLKQKFQLKAQQQGYGFEVIETVWKQVADINIEIAEEKIQQVLERHYQKALKKQKSDFELRHELQQKLVLKRIPFDLAKDYVSNFLEKQEDKG